MARYRLTRQAEKDYREILEFTLGQWGISQFEKYARSLDSAFEPEMMTNISVSLHNQL